jgi:hypothetical protein
MNGANAYIKYRQSLEEVQFLAYTVPAFLSYQRKIISDLKKKDAGCPKHPIYQDKTFADVYLEKDYEAIMAKQLLFTLYGRFELFIKELLKLFLYKHQDKLKMIVDTNKIEIDLVDVVESSTSLDDLYFNIVDNYVAGVSRRLKIKDRLNMLYRLVPAEFQEEIDVKMFDEIDFYYVVRNLFIHNDGVINEDAVKRAKDHFSIQDIGRVIRIDIDEFHKIFEILSTCACKFSEAYNKMTIR